MAIKMRYVTGGAATLVIIFLMVKFVPAFSRRPGPPPPKPASPVSAATVTQKTVPVRLDAIGNVEAYATVSVKSQIGGELTQVHFVKGQDVKKGDQLFTIDPRPYEAALKQAEANLAKDTAQLENARQEVRRYEEIAKEGIVSQEQNDQVRTNANSLEAAVQADKALVENAQLQLKYCYIYSPINGRTGDLMVDRGNLIKANDVPMVVINQIQPIDVSFSVPEKYLSDIKKYMASGKIKVEAFITKDEPPVEGELTFVDNTVDVGTGTIKLRATFANEEKRLWPGQFLTVAMTLTTKPNAVIVPSQAVQAGQRGEYVFVIKDDLTVESRPVTIATTMGNEAVVQQGLQPGERVVTDGQLRLVPGAKVEIKNGQEGAITAAESNKQ